MTDASSARPLTERFRDVKLIQEVLNRAVREALLRHKQAGNPIAVWQDGQVVWIPPGEIQVEAETTTE